MASKTHLGITLLKSWDILMSSLWCKIRVSSPDRSTKTSANKYNIREERKDIGRPIRPLLA